LLESTLAGHHLTAFLGLLDTEMLTFQYVNASHYPPYLIRDKEIIPLDTDGLFVGMFDDPQYEQKCIQLNQNDKLFLYTDGLLNVFNGTAKEKAVSNLQRELKRYCESPIRQVVNNIAVHIEDEPGDDIFILGLQILKKRSRRKTLTISSIPSEVKRVEDSLLPAISAKGYGERTLFGIKLAVEEAVINAIKHGNRMDSTKKVKIDFEIGEDKVKISVADEGEGFDISAVPDPTKPENIGNDSGRGLVLMKAYMDSVEFNEKGNEVRLLKYAPWYSGAERSEENAFATQK
jgi:serine/threonine-protein kinase RsbW